MNASSQWHWGAGDPDADFNDAAQDGALLLTAQDDAMASDALQLTYCEYSGAVGAAGSSSCSLPAPPSGAIVPAGASQGLGYGGGYGGGGGFGGGGGSALVAYDAVKAAAGRRRVIVGSDGIRQSGALVPKAAKDALSNEKLRPVDSGRGLALLEKVR